MCKKSIHLNNSIFQYQISYSSIGKMAYVDDIQQKDVSLKFTNYNYAFNNFYSNYKEQCIKIASKTKISEIFEIARLISAFIYEYDYTIKELEKKYMYRNELKIIKHELDNDDRINRIKNIDIEIINNKIEYARIYYSYFLRYLSVMGRFVTELTSSFMPNTRLQRKLVRFSNNQAFFENFIIHKKTILDSLSDSSIAKFRESFNLLVTFYYAYNLFINDGEKAAIDKLFTLALSIYLNEDTLKLLATDSPSPQQTRKLYIIESTLHNILLYCNSKMNESFSYYDVLPKIRQKIYVDKTLI